MSPLNAILVGLSESLATVVRAHLRVARVKVEFETADAASVIVRLIPPENQPHLFIVQMRTTADGEVIRTLREAFSGQPILAVCVAGQVFAANRAGADQVVADPLDPVDFEAALGVLAQRLKTSGRTTPVVAVSGTIPGCGASSIAMGLAMELSDRHRPTLLLECAFQSGALATQWGLQPRLTWSDLLMDLNVLSIEEIEKALLFVSPALALLPAPTDDSKNGPPSAAGVVKALGLTRQLAEIVVADVPCTYNDFHFETLWAADQVVFVLDQSLPAVRTGRMVLEAVKMSGPDKHVHIILNKYKPLEMGLSQEKVSEALGGAPVAAVPYDRDDMRAAVEGRRPGGLISATLRELALVISGGAAPGLSDSRSLFTRLLGLFKAHGG